MTDVRIALTKAGWSQRRRGWQSTPTDSFTGGSGGLAPSAAGPAEPGAPASAPPVDGPGAWRQSLRLAAHHGDVFFEAKRRHGDVFSFDSFLSALPAVVTSHPDHVRSLLAADPAIAPSLAKDSSLRPIVGDKSVLTAVGDRHRRQRKLLMPSFHGEAISRYREQIVLATEREIDGWPVGRPISLARAAQAITLEVIMGGVFGIDHAAADGPSGVFGRSCVRFCGFPPCGWPRSPSW